MTLEELREQADLNALGLLDEGERQAFREAIGENPQAGLTAQRRAAALVSHLAGVVKVVEPPARLRQRVVQLAEPAPAPKRSGFGWALVFASSSIMLLVLAGLLAYQINRLSTARRADAARFTSAAELMAASDTQQVAFGAGQPKPPQGRVFLNRERGVVLVAQNLAVLPANKTYEMWVIPKGQNPKPAGLFRAKSNGTALHFEEGAVDTSNVAAVAVTVEPAAGSQQPTTTPFIVAPVAP